ncbi:hypothetical protein PoB_005339500 [Plakobranchus ocellatus]|uniref:HTH iclR-type domain-containing protein n=1 Tax=Plakobranchus ocellatus TaxID=259542 RepID=A0AAV4C2H9_9GAST|nr:hypothetical protein PoB_005339500 [Plakobranchus ocellatus]
MQHINSHTIMEAIRRVGQGDEGSLRDVAKDLGMSKSVLHRYVREYRAGGDITRLATSYQHAMVFKQEEAELANYNVECSKMLCDFTSEARRHLAFEMTELRNFSFQLHEKRV